MKFDSYPHNHIITTALVLLLSVVGTQASVTVQGIVLDWETELPVESAHILISSLNLTDITDDEGHFSLLLPSQDEYELIFSHVAYREQLKKIYVHEGENITLEIRLLPLTHGTEDVVYTATKTWQLLKDVPVSTELITGTEIEDRAAITAAEALQGEIGLDIQEDYAGEGISIQGVDPNKVLILVDGSRVIGRVDGSIDLGQISTAGIRQIEIVKGAVSTLYGSEAIGGVVNIITNEPEHPFTVRLDLSGGGYTNDSWNFEDKSWSPSGSFEMKKGRFGFSGSARYIHEDLHDLDPNTLHTDGTEELDRVNADARLVYDIPGPAKVKVTGRIMDEQMEWVEDSGLSSISLAYDDKEINTRKDIITEIECRPKWTDTYSVKVYHSKNEHDWRKYKQTSPPIVKNFSKNNEDYTELSLQLTHNHIFGHRITFGGDMYYWNIDAESFLGGDNSSKLNSKLHAWDAYLQDEWNITDNWTLVPGIRYEQHKIYDENISPRLSALWKATDTIRIRASIGMGYRAPSSKELYYIFNHASAGYLVQGNDKLDPETSRNYSISAEHTYANQSVARITFFRNDIDNLIEYQIVGESVEYYLGIYEYRNVSSAVTQGVELERGFKFLDHWQLQLAYAFLETVNDQLKRPLLRRPKHTIRWELSWQQEKWQTRVWGRWAEKSLHDYGEPDEGKPEDWMPARQRWNASVNYNISSTLDTYIKAQNIFNDINRDYGILRGRTVTCGVRWNFYSSGF